MSADRHVYLANDQNLIALHRLESVASSSSSYLTAGNSSKVFERMVARKEKKEKQKRKHGDDTVSRHDDNNEANITVYHAFVAGFEREQAARLAWLGGVLEQAARLDRLVGGGDSGGGVARGWRWRDDTAGWWWWRWWTAGGTRPDAALALVAEVQRGAGEALAARREQLVAVRELAGGLASTERRVCLMGPMFEGLVLRAEGEGRRCRQDGGYEERKREEARARARAVAARDGGRLAAVLCETFRGAGRKMSEWRGKMKKEEDFLKIMLAETLPRITAAVRNAGQASQARQVQLRAPVRMLFTAGRLWHDKIRAWYYCEEGIYM